MNERTSDHIAEALIHLDAAANAEPMITYSENNDTPSGIAKYWLRRERLVPENSLLKSTRYGLRRRNLGQFLISDASRDGPGRQLCGPRTSHECQVYYDLENAFRCAGILASITDQDIEVVELD